MISGTSPLMTTTVASASMCSAAAATASPGAVGLVLDRDLDALGQPVLEPPLRVVDDDDLAGAGLLRGRDRPQDQRAAAERVQDLGQRGAHARSLAGGDDDDGGRGHRSHRSIGARHPTSRPLWGVVQRQHWWVLVRSVRFESWLPSLRSSVRHAMRTCVRATLHAKRNCARSVASRDVAEPRSCAHFGLRPAGGNYRLLRRWLDRVGHLDRPLRPARRHAGARERIPLERGARRALDVQPRQSQAAALRRRASRSGVRAVRPGRGLARPHDVADPRPHQRRGRRQPAREPADRLPELRRDARHALRPRRTAAPSRSARACTAARRSAPTMRAPAVLLAGLRARATTRRAAEPARAAGGAAAVRAAASRRSRRLSWSGVGRKYGVSDNAVRKWVRAYERERAARCVFGRELASIGSIDRLGWRPPCAFARSPPRSRPFSCPPLRRLRAIPRCRCRRCRRGCVHRLFGDPGHDDQLVRREVLDVAAGEAAGIGNILVAGVRAGGRRDRDRAGLLGLADLLPGRGRRQRVIGAISQSVNEYGGKVALATSIDAILGTPGRRAERGRRRRG